MMSPRYSMSFTTGGLLLPESIELARNFLRSNEWQSAIAETASGYVLSSGKPKSMQRVGREIANRLATLSIAELQFLTDTSSRSDQAALLWLAVCRTYRLVREFAIEVVSERFNSFQRELLPERYDSFVHDKSEWDEWLAARSPSTIERSRQVLFKIMKEAGVIDEHRQICRLPLSPALRLLLERMPDDIAVLPGGFRG